MKKLFFLGALFAVGLGFTACSSDKDVVAEESPQNAGNGGGNYIAIGINLPQTMLGVTRATDGSSDNAENVVYNDGMLSEYTVNDAILLVFGSDEKFKSAYNLFTTPWTDATQESGKTQEDVTRYSTKVVQKVNAGIAKNDLLLVILNNNGVISPFTDGASTITIGSTSYGTSNSFENIAKATITSTVLLEEPGKDASKFNKKGFFMTNAPLANAAGSGTSKPSASIRVLVPITEVYKTENEASSATADQVYVERALAKVTFDNSAPDASKEKMSGSKIDGATELYWIVQDWTLDNTNKSSYMVRNTTDVSLSTSGKTFEDLCNEVSLKYRYIGDTQTQFPSNQTYGYRTYFAKDPNYDDDGHSEVTFHRVGTSTTFSTSFGDENPQYCFENTFDVKNQNVDKTTLVQVGIVAKTSKAGDAVDLYTLGEKNKSYVYTLSTVKTAIATQAFDYLESVGAFTGSKGSITSSAITVTLDKEATTNTQAGECKITKLAITDGLQALLKSDYYSGSAGNYELKLTSTDNESTTDIDESKFGVGTETEKLLGKILKYKGGVSYYNIRIKHFGDLLTPWNTTEATKPSGSSIYPDYSENNYLGRYGVLRNNWYNLKVTSVRTLGEAEPHTADWPGTPDDELDNYITFQINILSWAKHVTQNADL